MRRITRKSSAKVGWLSATAATAVLAATLSPMLAATAAEVPPVVTVEEPPVLTFMTPEEYDAAYLKMYGEAAPAEAEQPTMEVPKIIQDGTGQVIDTTQTPSGEADAPEAEGPGGVASDDGEVGSGVPDIGGGGSGAVPWWNVLYSYTDMKRNKVFVRYGNKELGYHHFAGTHNLRNRVVFEHLMVTKPQKTAGARLEYLLWVADPSTMKKGESVFIVSQQATRTDDNKWKTPDGGYVGVITAYCKGPKGNLSKSKCPDWVNKLKK